MASSEGEAQPFTDVVSKIFSAWDSLQYAINQQLGGPHTYEKSLWLVEVTANFFKENADLASEEVEDWLGQVLFTEFNLVVEDGTLETVAKRLCVCFPLVQSQKWSQLGQKLAQLPSAASVKSAVAKSAVANDSQQDSSDSEGDEDVVSQQSQPHSEPINQLQQTMQSVQISPESSRNERNLVDEDGWTTVQKKKHK